MEESVTEVHVPEEIESGRDHPEVLAFIDRIRYAKYHEDRQRKMDEVEQDKAILDARHDRLEEGDHAYEKPSEYDMLFRMFFGEGYELPAASARKDRIETDLDFMANSLLPVILEDSQFERIHQDEIPEHQKYTGMPIIKVGTSLTTGKPTTQVVELSNIYFDPNGLGLDCSFNLQEHNYMKWACEKIDMDIETFQEQYPDYKDNVQKGDAVEDDIYEDDEQLNVEEENFGKLADTITVWDCWYVNGEKAVHIKFAGSNAFVIQEQEGKSYKIRDLRGRPVLPYQELPISDNRLGAFRQSLIGSVKDIVENFSARIMNPSIQTYIKIANPFHFLIGLEDPLEAEMIQEYSNLQGSGVSSFIPLVGDRAVGVQSAAPDSSIISVVEELRLQALTKIGQRWGVNMFRNEDAEFANQDKVTVFKGREADTAEAQRMVIKRNKRRYENIYNLLTSLYIKYGDYDDDLILIELPQFEQVDDEEVKTGATQTVKMNFDRVIGSLKSWKNEFNVDLNVQPRLNDEDKEKARDKLFDKLSVGVNQLNLVSEEQAIPFVNLMYEDVKNFQMQNVITREEIQKMLLANVQNQDLQAATPTETNQIS